MPRGEAEAELLKRAASASGETPETLRQATGLGLSTIRNALAGRRYLPASSSQPAGMRPSSASAEVYATLASALGLTESEVAPIRPDAAERMRAARRVERAELGRELALKEFSDAELLAEVARRMSRQAGSQRGL